jgi:glycosyltransferase involved in cell wall biosynthesis
MSRHIIASVAPRATSVVFLISEPLAPSPGGPSHRLIKLAEQVATHSSVTLAAPAGSEFPDGPFSTRETGSVDDPDLARALAQHDVAVVQTLPSPRLLLVARRHAPRLVVDLIAPLAFEAAEMGPADTARAAFTHWRLREQVAHIALADRVLCTNKRQRDLLLGVAMGAGILGGGASRRPLAERIAVVPHGINEEPPPRTRRRPLHDAGVVADGERIAVWAGGMWSWLDPLTAIRAVECLGPARPDLKLAVIGYEHPDPAQRAAHRPLAAEAARYVRERKLDDRVALLPTWLSRGEYFDHLHEADVGLSLHRRTLEGRFATRTRVLDYLSAGLPVVCTAGDTMSELVATHSLGSVIDALDVAGCAAAIDCMTSRSRARIERPDLLEAFRWDNVARPLVEFCADPGPPEGPSRREAMVVTARQYPALVRSVYRNGRGDLAHAAARSARRAVRAARGAL